MFRTTRWFIILSLASIGNVEAADRWQERGVGGGTATMINAPLPQRFRVDAGAPLSAVPGTDVDFDEDLETVRHRVITKLLEPAVDPHQIGELMDSIREDGSWPGIDYADTSRTGFEHQEHLDNMLALGRAFRQPGSSYHDNVEVREAVWKALDFWIGHDFLSENWWWNEIGTPQRIGDLLLIMDEATTDEQVEGSAPIVGRAHLGAWGARPGGDLIIIAGIMGKYALFRRDLDLLDEALTAIAGEVGFAVDRGDPSDVRGLQTDFSFHHRHDRVTSTITYGLGFASDFVDWADTVNGTRFAFPDESVRLIVDFFLDGISKTMAHGTYPDPGARNRGITRRGALEPRSSELPEALLRITSYRQDELEAIVRIRNDERKPELTSSRFFWHSEYYSHQRPHYFASVRMYSSRNHSMEDPYNSEGIQNHHLADGYNFITRTGEEYLDIFPVWDWQKIPGATIVQKPELPDPGEIQQPGVTDFVGAVTDGTYGAVAFDFVSPLDPLSARKSWFFFDDEFVALGAGIRSDSEYPVATTLNQSLLNGDVVSGQSGGAASVLRQGEHGLTGLAWVHHDSTAYLFPEPTAVRVENTARSGSWQDINEQAWARASREERKEVFTLWLDHGVAPQRKGYAYIVVPGIDVADIDRYREASPIDVFVNTPEVQAVAHEGLGIVQMVFYEPGEVEVGGGVTVAVDTPGLVMVKMSGQAVEEITTADPTRQGRSIPVTLVRAATRD